MEDVKEFKIERNHFYNLDCRDGLRLMKEQGIRVSSVITSPPYYNQRIYDIDKSIVWGDGWKGQLGLEPSPNLYVKHLCDIFDLIRDVVRDDGVIFVNIGDCYSSRERLGQEMEIDLPDNCLLLTPQRFAIEMVNRGWILRNIIIWRKKNAIPSSIKNKFTLNYEFIYFFSKKKEYFFKQQYEPYKTKKFKIKKETMPPIGGKKHTKGNKNPTYSGNRAETTTKGRYKRAIWDVGESFTTVFSRLSPPLQEAIRREYKDKYSEDIGAIWETLTSRNSDSHFAVFPKDLIQIPIKAGTPRYICNECNKSLDSKKGHKCKGGYKSGIVLDPFAGIGTSLITSLELGRDFIGFEISKKYYDIGTQKINKKRFKRLDIFLDSTPEK